MRCCDLCFSVLKKLCLGLLTMGNHGEHCNLLNCPNCTKTRKIWAWVHVDVYALWLPGNWLMTPRKSLTVNWLLGRRRLPLTPWGSVGKWDCLQLMAGGLLLLHQLQVSSQTHQGKQSLTISLKMKRTWKYPWSFAHSRKLASWMCT